MHGLLSLHAVLALFAVHSVATTQSNGFEFGWPDGIEQRSMSTPPAPPRSAWATQQVTVVSTVRQLLPLHWLPMCVGALAKGSALELIVQVPWHTTEAGLLQRSG